MKVKVQRSVSSGNQPPESIPSGMAIVLCVFCMLFGLFMGITFN